MKKRYRTKPTNRARLYADNIMERKAIGRYKDLYAEAMAKYGLERGIRVRKPGTSTNTNTTANASGRKPD